MRITDFLVYRKIVIGGMILPLLIFLIDARLLASPNDQEDLRVSNVDWKVQGEIIVITYDLNTAGNEQVKVKISLLNENDKSVKIVPQTITGDIGEGNFNGTGRTIRWDYLKDIPQGLQGEGYYFEINAEKVGGGMPWLYIAAGAAAVGGAVVLLGGSKSSSGNGTTSGGSVDLPVPPSRPPQ